MFGFAFGVMEWHCGACLIVNEARDSCIVERSCRAIRGGLLVRRARAFLSTDGGELKLGAQEYVKHHTSCVSHAQLSAIRRCCLA